MIGCSRFRHCRLLAVLLLLGFSGSAWSQSFSDVVVFGDGLSDPGNRAPHEQAFLNLQRQTLNLPLLNLPPGTSYNTNPDPVWAEIVARTFGASGKTLGEGGSNYAWGGGLVTDLEYLGPKEGFLKPPRVGDQIKEYLDSRPDDSADPNALYSVWAGGTDILVLGLRYLEDAAARSVSEGRDIGEILVGFEPRARRDAEETVADAYIEQIRRLRGLGARHIAVFNSFIDPSTAPVILSNPIGRIFRSLFRAMSESFNASLVAGLRSREDGIIPVNSFKLFQEIVAAPATYGFTEIEDPACNVEILLQGPLAGLPDADALQCGPEGSDDYPKTWAHGANEKHLFADFVHPSGATHATIAGLVTSMLAAPVQVSLAGEGGVEIAGIHRNAVSDEWIADSKNDRLIQRWRAYAAGHIGRHALDALPRLGEARADVQVLTLGAGYRATPDLWWGAALSFGRHDNDASGASLASTAVIGSLHGTWRRGRLYLSGTLSGGSTSVDIKRSTVLGPAVRAERGSTRAGQFGAGIDAAWLLGTPDGFRHGPFLALAWLDQRIDGYRENGDRSTTMNFSSFDRDSLIARGGYRVTAALGWEQREIRPYAGIAYEREFEDDSVSVTAGSNTMSGRFTLSGFTPPRQWVSGELGLAMELHGNANAFVGYSGRFGSQSRKDHELSLGLRVAF